MADKKKNKKGNSEVGDKTKDQLLDELSQIQKEQKDYAEKYDVLLKDFEKLESRHDELEEEGKELQEKLKLSKKYIYDVLEKEFDEKKVLKKQKDLAQKRAKKEEIVRKRQMNR